MRTRDIIRMLKRDEDTGIEVGFDGNAIYSRSCKVRVPRLTSIFGGSLATDILKVNLSFSAAIEHCRVDQFLHELSRVGSLEGCVHWLDITYFWEDQPIDFDYDDPYELHNAMEIDLSLDPSHPHRALSHYLETDKHTFTPKDEGLGYEYTYIDNWVDINGTEVRLEEQLKFKKWIRKEGTWENHEEDPFSFSGFESDKDEEHRVYIGDGIRLNEKRAIKLADAWVADARSNSNGGSR